jgi:hypothetical protein
VAEFTGSNDADPPGANRVAGSSPTPGDHRSLGLSVVAAVVLALVYTIVTCLVKTTGIMCSTCGNCSHSMRLELACETPLTTSLCLAAWLVARESGPRLALRFTRSAGLACAGMWLLSWGFILGWW